MLRIEDREWCVVGARSLTMNITRLNGSAAGEGNCEFYMLIYSRRFSRAARKTRGPRASSNCNRVLALSSLVAKSIGGGGGIVVLRFHVIDILFRLFSTKQCEEYNRAFSKILFMLPHAFCIFETQARATM